MLPGFRQTGLAIVASFANYERPMPPIPPIIDIIIIMFIMPYGAHVRIKSMEMHRHWCAGYAIEANLLSLTMPPPPSLVPPLKCFAAGVDTSAP